MLAFGFAALLVFGVLLVLVGSNIAELAAAMQLDMEEVGLLGATLSMGIGFGVLLAGPLVDRFPRRPMLVASLVLTAAALLSVGPVMSLGRAMLHVTIAGMGAGFYETLLNVVTIERYRERATHAVTWIHTAATLGAVLAPPLLGWASARGGFALGFQAAGIAILGLVAWSLFVPLGSRESMPPEALKTDRLRISHPTLLALCAVAFAYIGAEASITLFAVPYATDVLILEPERGRNVISAFWMGILLGRLVLLARRETPGAGWLVLAGISSGSLMLACVVLQVPHVEIWIGACGLLVAGVFPIMVTLAGEYFPDARGTAIGISVGSGSLGGFVIPWLVGWVALVFGTHVAIASLSLWFLLIALGAIAVRRSRATAQQA
ncbi:MAG: MFS transporter [Myxococcota bacterium]